VFCKKLVRVRFLFFHFCFFAKFEDGNISDNVCSDVHENEEFYVFLNVSIVMTLGLENVY